MSYARVLLVVVWLAGSEAASVLGADSAPPIVREVGSAAGWDQGTGDKRGDLGPRARDDNALGPVPLGSAALPADDVPVFDKGALGAGFSAINEIEAESPMVAEQLAHLKARAVPETYAEVEIRLDRSLSLADVLALPQAPGSTFEELDDPHRVVVQVPSHVAGRLIKQGVELSVRRRFILLERGQVDADAFGGNAAAAGACGGGGQEGQNSTDIAIPDTNTWVSSNIPLSGAPSGATVTCLDVHYEIIHTYIGDLDVDLNDSDTLPNHNLWGPGQGGATDDLNETVLGIHTFDGEPVNQTWRLFVRDGAALDSGYIDTWSIKVYYDAPTTVWNAWWTDEKDPDGDGYRSVARLNWDPDIVGCSGSVTVFEKIYWMRANNGIWNLIATTSPHTLTNCITGDSRSARYEGGPHDLYDWKIEIYRTGEHFTPDYTRSPANDVDLDNYPMELPSEELVPTVWGAWWTDAVDVDTDGCVRSARLQWDVDVAGCSGSLSVVDKVYWKPAASGTWSQIAEAGPRTINNCASADSLWVDILSVSACGPFDYKIEVYYAGESSPAVTAWPSDDPDLNDHQEESAQDYCTGAACSDGMFCNGVETCGMGGNCQAGTDPCPGRLCDETNDRCVDCLSDANCSDGVFCSGPETCDAGGVCIPGVPPCSPGQFCVEPGDALGGCFECLIDAHCDDGNPCTDNVCNDAGFCTNTPLPIGTSCSDDGNECTDDYCYHGDCVHFDLADGSSCGNGSDTECDNPDICVSGVCLQNYEPSGAGCTSDANDCTNDVCNDSGSCTHSGKPDGSSCGSELNTECDNPDSCYNGACQPNYEPASTLCRAVTGPCDREEFCTGDSPSCPYDSFLPNTVVCRSAADECDRAEFCTSESAFCPTDEFAVPPAPCTDDGDPCTYDFCDGSGDCIHPEDPNCCPPDWDCCQDADCSDGAYCTGVERCALGTCLAGGPPCGQGRVCNEEHTRCDPDCNDNRTADHIDIAEGRSFDRNENSVPDECEDLPSTIMDGVRLLEDRSQIAPMIRFERGLPHHVEARVPVAPELADDPVLSSVDYLYRLHDLYQVSDPLSQLFLRRIESRGKHNLFFGQQKNGIVVHAAELAVHIEDNHVVATHGKYLTEIPAFPPPVVHADAARQIAVASAPALNPGADGYPVLMYFNAALVGGGPDETHLAWRFIVRGFRLTDGAGGRWTVFVDSHTGDVLSVLDEIRTGKNYDLSTAHHDTSTTCWFWPHSDSTTQWFTEGGPTGDYPSTFPGGDIDGDNMWYFTEATYNFFKVNFGRRSFDNDDEQIEAYVHVGTNWANASANDICLQFGDGWAVRDMYAHEWTHGMVFETSDLRYQDQSGALNEHFADFFGAMVDEYDWVIGEDLPNGAIRSLANPTAFGDPDHLTNYVVTTGDHGGVHTNSGIPSKAAHLMAMGGTHHGVTVDGIGITATMQILYEVVTRELGSNSDFMDCRDAAVRVTKSWITSKRFYWFGTDTLCSVVNAYAAVGLGDRDLDCDGIPDPQDSDDDGDYIPDSQDNCPNIANPDQRNSDGAPDGGDACDPDNDNDGILDDGDGSGTDGDDRCQGGAVADCDDNCPRHFNPNQDDDDNDIFGDICDDDDNDDVFNPVDNCRYVWNTDQVNHDHDGLGDACDPDDDNDGVPDDEDSCPKVYDPDQTGLACNESILRQLAGFEIAHDVDLIIPFPPPWLGESVQIPLRVLTPEAGPNWLPDEFRMQIGVSLPADLPVFVMNDRGRMVAQGSGGLMQTLSFQPLAGAHYRFPPLDMLPGRSRATQDSVQPGGGEAQDAFVGERYYLVIYTSPEVASGVPYPLRVTLQSRKPVEGDFDYNDDVSLLDYWTFYEAFRGPALQTIDARTDFDGDTDTDLRDLAVFQGRFAPSGD